MKMETRTPSGLDIETVLNRVGIGGLLPFCRELIHQRRLSDLESLLMTKAKDTYSKGEVPQIVAAAILEAGPDGVCTLIDLLLSAPGLIYPVTILQALWFAADDQPVLQPSLGLDYGQAIVSEETREHARAAIDDLVVQSLGQADLYDIVLSLQSRHSVFEAAKSKDLNLSGFAAHAMRVVQESSISLTDRLISELESLISQDLPEARYQEFLEEHPVFLDPLAAEVFNRHRLGAELITDFVVRRHDSRYVTVEIERPQDAIFIKSNDFAARFNHAIGQVMDFQGWVASNVAYARTHLPLIENPKGLLVIGRRSTMSPQQQDKLRRWCANSRHIEVQTFDDLVTHARSLYSSLRRRF